MTAKTRVPETTNGKNEVKITAPKKLDVGCGVNKQPGFKGIDTGGNADILWDLNDVPWPIKASCVEEVFCSHYVEHIPHWRPGWELDGWWRFFDELYRVMKKDATAEFIHPYRGSSRAFWDPTHVRFIDETTWYYLNKDWRTANGLDHYCGSCNFEVVTIDAIGISDEYIARNLEQQAYTRTHYWNVIPDLKVLLKAVK